MENFRLIRTVVIPEDIPEETDGVNWAKKSDGLLFGFETDENGAMFELREIYCEYDAGRAEGSPGIGGFILKNSSAVPTYGSTDGENFDCIVELGKNGNKIKGWFRIEPITDDKYISYGVSDVGASYSTIRGLRKAGKNNHMPTKKISTYILNEKEYGFLPGSTFTFYGR